MNDARSAIQRNVDEATAIFGGLAELAPQLDRAAAIIGDSLLGGRKLLTCGNGGSAADAAHMTTEFVCRFVNDRRPYPAICLNVHGGDMTAICNDYTFEHVFERQVRAYGRPGDVLVALSTSGASENVRRAVAAARPLGLTAIALLGRDGGPTRGLADVELLVEADDTARIQEAHKLLIHTITQIVDARLCQA